MFVVFKVPFNDKASLLHRILVFRTGPGPAESSALEQSLRAPPPPPLPPLVATSASEPGAGPAVARLGLFACQAPLGP